MDFPKHSDVSEHMVSTRITASRRGGLFTNDSSATRVIHVLTTQ